MSFPFSNEQNCDGFKFAFETAKKSPAWQEFLEGVEPKLGTPHIVCKHCKFNMPHPNRDGHKSTTNMKKHLKMCSKYKAVQLSNGSDNRVDLLGELFLDIPCHRPVMTGELLREKAL